VDPSYRSDAFEAIHTSIEAMCRAGTVDKETKLSFDKTCLGKPNPWLKLGQEVPYILRSDDQQIRSYNELVRNKEKEVISSSIAEPFIGNPDTARLVLLSLNPGHSEKDTEWHKKEDFKRAMFANLQHEPQPYPFYPLNPQFNGNGAGEWWRPRTLELQRESGLKPETFAERLLVIEWFPYHTMRSPVRSRSICGTTGRICESQRYSFQLAKDMSQKRGVLVVGMRSRRLWAEADGDLGRIPYLNNPQCGYVSRGNTDPTLFRQMITVLSA